MTLSIKIYNLYTLTGKASQTVIQILDIFDVSKNSHSLSFKDIELNHSDHICPYVLFRNYSGIHFVLLLNCLIDKIT